MRFLDEVYGSVIVDDAVAQELLGTKAMQRLKGVNQHGPAYLIFPKLRITRWDHSLGVYELLRRFDATLEECVAGLVHDVSHTAFSHVADFVYMRHDSHDFADSLREQFVRESDIPDVLLAHGLEVSDILDEKRFPLLERKLPSLCADRIDYALRDALRMGILSKNQVDAVLAGLTVEGGSFAFKDVASARLFADSYIACDEMLWGSSPQIVLYQVVADILRDGVKRGFLTEDELFLSDAEVLERLFQDMSLRERWNALEGVRLVYDENDYDYHVKTKIRYVDPQVLGGGRLSDLDKVFAKRLEGHLDRARRGMFVRIERHI
ncbi:MAG: HD domain-containing protein [Candidatus Diapherotrites archaeon]|nr:HD domain-containing protein [Candidatus Diapherotrites archaeon]